VREIDRWGSRGEDHTDRGRGSDLVVCVRSPLLSRLMWVGRRALVFTAIAAAAAGLAWASTGRFEPFGSGSSRASVSIDQRSGEVGLAVVETARSPVVRALSDSKASRAQLSWGLLAACGLAAVAVGFTWSRRHRLDWWSSAQDRLLRSAVPVRAPPLSLLV
jgi:hypothetical protein